jgi:hypothetical protein
MTPKEFWPNRAPFSLCEILFCCLFSNSHLAIPYFHHFTPSIHKTSFKLELQAEATFPFCSEIVARYFLFLFLYPNVNPSVRNSNLQQNWCCNSIQNGVWEEYVRVPNSSLVIFFFCHFIHRVPLRQ